jgi:hypothetical protein
MMVESFLNGGMSEPYFGFKGCWTEDVSLFEIWRTS